MGSGNTTWRQRQRRGRGSIQCRNTFGKQQNTFSHYIAAHSLLDLCEGLERALGVRVGMRWWEQEGLNLEREREAVEAAAERDGG